MTRVGWLKSAYRNLYNGFHNPLIKGHSSKVIRGQTWTGMVKGSKASQFFFLLGWLLEDPPPPALGTVYSSVVVCYSYIILLVSYTRMLLVCNFRNGPQKWPVIVAFRPAPPSRYIMYKVSRPWDCIVGYYNVTKNVCLPSQTAIAIVSRSESCTVKVGQATWQLWCNNCYCYRPRL